MFRGEHHRCRPVCALDMGEERETQFRKIDLLINLAGHVSVHGYLSSIVQHRPSTLRQPPPDLRMTTNGSVLVESYFNMILLHMHTDYNLGNTRFLVLALL